MVRSLSGMLAAFAFASAGLGQTIVETQEVKELKPTGSLGTCLYAPTARETPFFKELGPGENATGSFMDKEPFQVQGKKGKYVSWYGVVRGIARGDGEPDSRLLLEQRYFDGETDCHIMLVSKGGAGDFVALLKVADANNPALSLVRAYGKVVREQARIPYVEAEYVRVWPWFTFTFTDLGPESRGNPRWTEFRRWCKRGRIYNPYPTEDYYLNILGDPKDFGTMLKGISF